MTYAIGVFIGFLGGFFTAALMAAGGRGSAYSEGFEDAYRGRVAEDGQVVHDLWEYGPGATG